MSLSTNTLVHYTLDITNKYIIKHPLQSLRDNVLVHMKPVYFLSFQYYHLNNDTCIHVLQIHDILKHIIL